MLIQAGQEEYLLPEASSRAGDHIRNDFFVSMAQMRLAIHVINRCCDVKAFAHSPLTVANEAPIGNCGFLERVFSTIPQDGWVLAPWYYYPAELCLDGEIQKVSSPQNRLGLRSAGQHRL